MTFPSADDVAVAIVAACRETGDNPIKCANGGEGAKTTNNRARHYALHALVHVFPKANRYDVARCVGAPGKPNAFWHNSWNQIVRPLASDCGHMANWWDDAAYDRVIQAIQAARTARAVGAKVVIPKHDPKLGMLEADGYRPPPGTIEKVLEDDAGSKKRQGLGTLELGGYRPPPGTVAKVLGPRHRMTPQESARYAEDIMADDERPRFGGLGRREFQPAPLSDKAELNRILAEAAANTAKLQPKE